MQALRYFRENYCPALFFAGLLREAKRLQKTAKLCRQDARFSNVIRGEKVRISVVHEDGSADHFIEDNQRRRHH